MRAKATGPKKDFRQEAVNLLLSSGRLLKRVAAELGISGNSLRTWRDRALGNGRAAQAASTQPKGRSGAPLADAGGRSAACNAKSNTCAASVNRAERDRLPQDATSGECHRCQRMDAYDIYERESRDFEAGRAWPGAKPARRREALPDGFEKSGASGPKFERLTGIKYATFAGWVLKRRRQRGRVMKTMPGLPARVNELMVSAGPVRLLEA